MPSVSLQAGYERQSAPLWDNDGRGGGVARVVATIPIYTGGLAQTQERAALHGHAAAAYQVAGTMAQIRTAVVRSWSQMAAARASITSIRKQQAASKTALDGILAERKLGQRTMSEVVAAQQAALTSDTAYEQRTRRLRVPMQHAAADGTPRRRRDIGCPVHRTQSLCRRPRQQRISDVSGSLHRRRRWTSNSPTTV